MSEMGEDGNNQRKLNSMGSDPIDFSIFCSPHLDVFQPNIRCWESVDFSAI